MTDDARRAKPAQHLDPGRERKPPKHPTRAPLKTKNHPNAHQQDSPSGASTGSQFASDRARQRSGATRHAVASSAVEPHSEQDAAVEQNVVRRVALPDSITVRDLAAAIHATPVSVLRELMQNGVIATINQPLDFDTAAIIAHTFGWEVKPQVVSPSAADIAADVIETAERSDDADKERTGEHNNLRNGHKRGRDKHPQTSIWDLRRRVFAASRSPDAQGVSRPPVVAVMGHVDHGKTTLLDAIRRSDLAAQEAGGITQHIGVYVVTYNSHPITFLDTPGHEAFAALRARGAQVTDIVVLVVAADDGVMPQTIEALAYAREAQVPVIVAINKMDKPEARPDLVKQTLAQHGLIPDDWGGNTLYIPVSAKHRQGIEDLLEAILLVAESTHTIRADPNQRAIGTVIESRLSKREGVIATVLVQNGTLRTGDVCVAGAACGRVRAMFDCHNQRVTCATPSTPVNIIGLDKLPAAGDIFEVVKDGQLARAKAAQHDARMRQKEHPNMPRDPESALNRMLKAKQMRCLRLVVKAATQGSLQPLVEQIDKLNAQLAPSQVSLKVIGQGTGDITVKDIDLAIPANAVVLAYEVSTTPAARQHADAHHIPIRSHNVIYHLLEQVASIAMDLAAPEYVERVVGSAAVLQVFPVAQFGAVAGVRVTDGTISRSAHAHVLRDGKIIFTGAVASLRRQKDDVKEVRQGVECGVALAGFSDFSPGDVITFFVSERRNRESK